MIDELRPVMCDWEVRIKWGRGWRFVLPIRAGSDVAAARQAHTDWNARTVKVKPQDIPDKWRVFHFRRSDG